jgi:hypothetical protein
MAAMRPQPSAHTSVSVPIMFMVFIMLSTRRKRLFRVQTE